MRALWVTAMAAVAAGAIASGAASAAELPDTDISATVKATKVKGGGEGSRGLAISAKSKITTEPGAEPPIITGVDIWIGKGLVWNGGKYATCSKRMLDRKGPSGCPRKSIMGAATATAWADTVVTRPDVVLVNGGAKRVFAYTTLYRPSLVKETIVVRETKASGPWARKESFRVPENLQIVAGVPIRVTALSLKVGGKPYAPEFIASKFCPAGGWRYKATAHLLYDLLSVTERETITGTIPCPS